MSFVFFTCHVFYKIKSTRREIKAVSNNLKAHTSVSHDAIKPGAVIALQGLQLRVFF